jgi:hypothetical protein
MLLKWFKLTILDQRVSKEETLEEDKEAMCFQCYKLLCKKFFFEGDKDEYLFALLPRMIMNNNKYSQQSTSTTGTLTF